DRYGGEAEGRRGQEQVLGDVPCLREREAVRARAVLEARPPEHGRYRDDGRAVGENRAVGGQVGARAPRQGSEQLEPMQERVVVVEGDLESLDAVADGVELEWVQSAARRGSAERLRCSVDRARDSVGGVEQRREIAQGERMGGEGTAGATHADGICERRRAEVWRR